MQTPMIPYRLSLLLVLAISFSTSLQSQSEKLSRKIHKIVHRQAAVSFERTPGLIIGVLDQDSTYVFPFGSLYRDTMVKPGPTDIFELGEISQVLSTALFFKLASAGLLHPDSMAMPDRPEASFTYRQLLQHHSGLPRHLEGMGWIQQDPTDPYGNISREDLLGFLRSASLSEPATSYQYSNLNFAYLQMALEDQFQMPFDSLLQTYLPEYRSPEPDERISPSYDKALMRTYPWEVSTFRAAVGLRADLCALLKFLRVHIDPPSSFWVDYLNTLRQNVQPTGMRKNTFIAHGWHLIRRKKKPDYWVHTGASRGHRAYLAFVPKTRRAVVVLSNSPYGLNGLGFRIMEYLN